MRDPALIAGLAENEHDVASLLGILSSPGRTVTEVRLPCPNCGGDLTEPRQFNLMFETYVGAVRDDESKAYLRPETAQGMFYNFKNVVDSTRVKIPFGICQVGRSFRNEVTPRNFIFRSREFEQMELEFFCHPSEADDVVPTSGGRRASTGGQPRARRREPPAARARRRTSWRTTRRTSGGCCDVEYAFPFSGEKGFGELEGIAYRSDYDLRQHQTRERREARVLRRRSATSATSRT